MNTERTLEQQDTLQLGVSRDGVPSRLAVRTGSPLPQNPLDARATVAEGTATHHVGVTHYLEAYRTLTLELWRRQIHQLVDVSTECHFSQLTTA